MPSELHAKPELMQNTSYEDFKEKFVTVISIVAKQKVFIAFWCIFIAAVALFYLKITPSTFSSEASIILEPKRQSITTSEIINSGGSINLDSSQTESQIQVIRSERLMKTVFESLKIADMDEFKYGNPTFIENTLRYFGFKRKIVDLSAMDEESRLTIAFNNFSSRLSVRRIGQSYVLEISMYSLSADVSARLANSIAMQYIKQQIESKSALSSSGSEYLQGRISRFKDQLDLASRSVQLGVVPTEVFPDADARIIGAAVKPLNRSSPQRGLILLFSLIAGPIVGVMIVLAFGIFDTLIGNERQLKRLSKSECLANIYKKSLNSRNEHVESSYSKHRLSLQIKIESYRHNIAKIASFLINFNGSSRSKLIGILYISNDVRVLNISLEVAKRVSSEGKSVLLITDDLNSIYNSRTAQKNRINDGYLPAEKHSDNSVIFRNSDVDLQIVNLSLSHGEVESSKNSTCLLQVVEKSNKSFLSLVEVDSIDNVHRLRSISDQMDGIIIVVDSNYAKFSDWNTLEDKLSYLNISLIATIIVL